MSRPSDAKFRFAVTAARLFSQKGYNGVGLTALIAQSRAPKGSFYHHFPGGKEELAEASLRLAGAEVERLIDRAFQDAGSFQAGAGAFAAALAERFERSGWLDGCPVTSIAIDAMPQSERLSRAAKDVMAAWIAAVAVHAARLGATATGARELAERFVIAIEGGWIVARVLQSSQPFQAALTMLAAPPFANDKR